MSEETENKYLLMPDSFKGTMDAIEVCEIMRSAILQCDPDADIVSVPVADGGEGTVECFLSAFGGEKREVEITGPYGESIKSFYGMTGDTAVVEMAAAAGFSQTNGGRKDPSKATTFGVGKLIRAAVEAGAKKIILGLGGSCTNDCGAGMAAALGTVFRDGEGRAFVPAGGDLDRVRSIDCLQTKQLLQGVSIEAMCDIDNPLYGKNGAACVFAPQKGADSRMVKLLDDNLRAFAEVIEAELGVDVSKMPGGGAAGGMGAGAKAFLGAELKQGIDVVLDMLGFEDMLRSCRVIFTGEGQFDSQSLGGKVVIGISRRAKSAGVPVIVVAGRLKGEMPKLKDLGITRAFQTDPGTYATRKEMLSHCREDLFATMMKILKGGYI